MVIPRQVASLVALALFPGIAGAAETRTPTRHSPTARPLVESIEVRTLGVRLADPTQQRRGPRGATQLTNPATGTRCTMLIVPADPAVDPEVVREATGGTDPGIKAPAPPCLPSNR